MTSNHRTSNNALTFGIISTCSCGEAATRTNRKQTIDGEARPQHADGSRRTTRPFLRATVFATGLLASLVVLWSPPVRAADPATVTFSLDFPGSDPEHYSISVQSDGRARYECSGRISRDSDDTESYQTEFNSSDANRTRIFDLAAQAHYFSGKIDSGNKKLAFTGAKKLTYRDGQRDSAAAYNFSQLPAVQQLTALFQGIGATLEFGRRLTHYHRYQKLALDDELKRMEMQARAGELSEVQAVKSILQEIYDDSSVINVVRARAQRIMEMGDGPGTRR
jgi:hypothetical protein